LIGKELEIVGACKKLGVRQLVQRRQVERFITAILAYGKHTCQYQYITGFDFFHFLLV
jgi:hypothetical protein